MKVKRIGNNLIIRIDKGEELMEKIGEACEKNEIKLGCVSGLGAVERAVIGFFDPKEKEYIETELDGDYEITSLIGNVTDREGKVYLHLHINLAGRDQKVIGGHLNRARVSATCEVLIMGMNDSINRIRDPETGLNLLDI